MPRDTGPLESNAASACAGSWIRATKASTCGRSSGGTIDNARSRHAAASRCSRVATPNSAIDDHWLSATSSGMARPASTCSASAPTDAATRAEISARSDSAAALDAALNSPLASKARDGVHSTPSVGMPASAWRITPINGLCVASASAASLSASPRTRIIRSASIWALSRTAGNTVAAFRKWSRACGQEPDAA